LIKYIEEVEFAVQSDKSAVSVVYGPKNVKKIMGLGAVFAVEFTCILLAPFFR
jgi:hypothetical protein